MPRRSSRRAFLRATAATAVLVPACRDREVPGVAAQRAPIVATNPQLVRVASVPTAVEGDVLPELLRGFTPATELVAQPNVYDLARAGKADLVVSHYGHHDCEQFVLDGLGEWPRTVFANQMALVGPPSDPANVRDLPDAVEAFKRIAAGRLPFVVNDLDGVRYLVEVLWHAIGKPQRAGWLIDDAQRRDDAMTAASKLGGYTLWGLTPFLRARKRVDLALEPLVTADPLLHRLLVAVVVRAPGCNLDGARALQSHLLAPATQARIREIRYPLDARICWVPAGRHNRTGMLPKA